MTSEYINPTMQEYPKRDAPYTAVTTVTNISWIASRNRSLKPIVHHETAILLGCNLTKVSGDNAKFIIDNNIGPGAKILITYINNIIPRILSVISPASNNLNYPDPKQHGSYDWNTNRTEFALPV